jgi:putative toxin-antitoxin system antitoxin component (TIGR02293 family)
MATPAKSLPPKPFLASLHLNLASVESGVPLSTISSFVTKSGIPLKEIYEIVIPARTLKHRRARNESLTLDESDKLARLVRVFDHALAVFESIESARLWLEEPKRRFDNRTPLEMLRSELGGRLVEEMLGQIEYGIFA